MSASHSNSSFLRVACVGAFGHASSVFSDLSLLSRDRISLTSVAPGFEGESMDSVLRHPWAALSSPKTYTCPRTLLAAESPDILVVNTRPGTIGHNIILGLAAGCHVIAEKPISLSVEELTEVHTAWKMSGKALLGMFTMRQSPVLQEARRIVAAGEIGRVVLANTRKSYKWGNRPDWFRDREVYGGTWPWVGIHNLDMAHFVTGLHVNSVTARHANLAHPDLAPCEDVAAGLFDMENGALLTVSIDLCRPGTAPTHGDDWIRVVGSRGVLEANSAKGSLQILNDDGSRQVPVGGDSGDMFRRWVESLHRKETCADPLAFYLTFAALLARESADCRSTIGIPPGVY